MIHLWKSSRDEVDEKELHYIVKDVIKRYNSVFIHVFKTNYKDFASEYNRLYPLSVQAINPAGIEVTDLSDNTDMDIPDTALHAKLNYYFPRNNNNSNNNQQLLLTQDANTVTTAGSTIASSDTNDVDGSVTEIPMEHTLYEGEVFKLIRILKDVFVHSWTNEETSICNKMMEAKMTKFSKLHLLTKATDEASEIIANEPSADMLQFQEIIDKKVEENTKKLTKDFENKLQQLLRNNNHTNHTKKT
jgi:hypothetical protein